MADEDWVCYPVVYQNWKETFNYIWELNGNTFIQFLLDAGLDVNASNKCGKTMLSYAAEQGNLEITDFLVENGGCGEIANSDGSLPLHIAAQYGRKDIIKYYLNKGISADSWDHAKCTPLHYVARCDISSVGKETCQEILHILVYSNADLEAVNEKGRTPLFIAVENRSEDLVKLFVQSGANVNYSDKNQLTVLHYCSVYNYLGVARSLVEGRCAIDLDARNSDGATPLIMAASQGNKEVLELLLKSGANFNYSDDYQNTVLFFCCMRGWLDTVKYLVNSGCDINSKNVSGITPLFIAVDRSHYDVVKYLIDLGANLDYCTVSRQPTLLHYVCRYGWLDVVKSLIQRGCEPNVHDFWNTTCLHEAVKAHQTEIVKYLLENGANWNLEDNFGFTAFHQCIRRPLFYLDGIVVFIENGAYFQYDDYNYIVNDPLLKKGILENGKVCTQAVINHFNNVELPKIYDIPVLSESLPLIEKLKFASKGNVAQDIENSLNDEIQSKGYCNVLNARPILLSCLCVRSLVKYYEIR